MSATLHDVARDAGVSIASASLVLSGKSTGRISPETAYRIKESAHKLGYVTHMRSRTTQAEYTRTIGMISDVIASTPYAVDIIGSAVAQAKAQGYVLSIIDLGSTDDIADNALRTLREQRVERIVFACMYHRDITLPEPLPQDTVIINGYSSHTPTPSCVPDEYAGAYHAVQYLTQLGHERIAYLTFAENIPAVGLRINGWRQALTDAGLAVLPDHLCATSYNYDPLRATLKNLFNSTHRPTALFCFNDRLAARTYIVLREMGYEVPQDVSVIGFDNNIDLCESIHPGLTTIQLPHADMARWAIDYITHDQSEEATHTWPMAFDCPLVVRDSCRRIRPVHA